ncbi:N-acetylglucosamine-6-phosphate deacetylase [Paenibacillus senegalensis]|uniref:N-acetylglucosamine-6-phosphate deacetylase n=1 Tax=Paenibacillus senegalensis TaxID=1465766 RepID=UPI000288F240|nr:N-acetylglucosamine-6-phosphate deacetylase [Paenibacillus senegalensis]
MKDTSNIYIYNAKAVTETEVIESAIVLIKDGVIAHIGQAMDIDSLPADILALDAEGSYLVPGFIDLHVHGGAGADFMDDDPLAAARVCRFHVKHGTTGLLMTTRTVPAEVASAAVERLGQYVQQPDPYGAVPLGIHLEGPFLNEQFKGAQNADDLLPPSVDWAERWIRLSGETLRLCTLAPELEGADVLISWLAEQGVIVSAGHCGPNHDEMKRAIDRGVRHITHCFNGMRGFTHREPGMLAALLMDDRVAAELIMDTIHVHPASGQLLFHNKGTAGTVLITDASRATGMPDGEYPGPAGRKLTVKSGIVRLPTGELAGSTLTMNRAVGNAVQHMGLSLVEAVCIASLTPARKLGIDNRTGSLVPGKSADLVMLDSKFDVRLTLLGGRIVYQSESSGFGLQLPS